MLRDPWDANEMVKTAPSIEEVLPKFSSLLEEGPIGETILTLIKGF